MARTIQIDPVTRIEGHMRVDLDIDGGKVTAARCSGSSFRGFEPIRVVGDPREAPQITQRICGVCPIPHARCSCLAIEKLIKNFWVVPQATVIRNLIVAANFVDSHLAHFYILAAPDYVAGIATAGGWPVGAPAQPWKGGEKLKADVVAGHAIDAITIRRKCHEITAMVGGKSPHAIAVIPGGVTTILRQDQIDDIYGLWQAVQTFVEGPYAEDIAALSSAFPEYTILGATDADMLSYGGFPLLDGSSLFTAGTYGTAGVAALDETKITESVATSSYEMSAPLGPSVSETKPVIDRDGSYSWVKAPRYGGKPCEVGPLARAVVSGRDPGGRGVWARHRARRDEASLLCIHALAWSKLLYAGQNGLPTFPVAPTIGSASGLHEAPRGALGHWLSVNAGLITRYNVITPTTWNGSPRDESGQPGPIEAALVGVPIADPSDPIEAMRVVHSFDPCLQCAVH